MNGKILVVIYGVSTLFGVYMFIDSMTHIERFGWFCSFLFSYISMMNQIELNSYKK